MAKALFGHVVAGDPRLALEARGLRARVADLERELAAVRAANVALMGRVRVEDEIRMLDLAVEPALT